MHQSQPTLQGLTLASKIHVHAHTPQTEVKGKKGAARGATEGLLDLDSR